jgi:hypothetical protein
VDTRVEHTRTGNLRKGLRADSGGINAVVQKPLEGFPELQGRNVEVTQGAYPLFFAGLLGRPDEIAE